MPYIAAMPVSDIANGPSNVLRAAMPNSAADSTTSGGRGAPTIWRQRSTPTSTETAAATSITS